MAGQIKIDTDQVRTIAQSIEALNGQLRDELNHAKSTVTGLSTTWESDAATATVSAFTEFSNKYFQQYYDTIDNYVKFLRNAAAQQYDTTEQTNEKLADAFK